MKRTDKRISFGRGIKILAFFAVTFMLTAVIISIAFGVYVSKYLDREVDISLFNIADNDGVTRFYYYKDGDKDSPTELESERIYGGDINMYVKLEDIPKSVKNAFVAIEDKRFNEHKGVDWYRTFGAGINYIFNFRNSFGGSTITQQLIKNITGNNDNTVQRKLQEIIWALDLEKKLDKDDILELYLNVINLSQGCCGVQTAARKYFSKDVRELDLCESACIAAITNNPSKYDPIKYPENNKKRRQLIFDSMLELEYISEDEYRAVYDADVELKVDEGIQKDGKVSSWYVDTVINDVISDLVNELGYSESTASHLIYSGGLKIYTAMDPEIQQALEEYYADSTNFPERGSGVAAQSSMVIIDPYSGDLLGVVGARGTKNANRLQSFATDTLRPTGSVIKPLSVYAPAIEAGIINYATVYDDTPVEFVGTNQDPWPNNATHIYSGLSNVNYAVTVSLNTVPIKILSDLGIDNSFNFLKDQLCINNLIERRRLSDGKIITDKDRAALALGQMNYGLTLREVSAAYSIFADSGEYNKCRSYFKVEDSRGNVILENTAKETRAISEETSTIMNQMLMNVVESGSANALTLDEYIDVGGKTGTSQSYYDRWFIGYTPYYIGGVWYGYEYPKALTNDTRTVCLDIWDDIMHILHEKYIRAGESKSFLRSDNVIKAVYCKDSGKLMSPACRADPRGDRAETGYFKRGTEPRTYCDCHVLVDYDAEIGGVVDINATTSKKIKVGLIRVERTFPKQIYVTDAQYVYRELSVFVLPSDKEDLPFFANMLGENEYCGISDVEMQYNRYCFSKFNYTSWLMRRKWFSS